MDTIFSLPYSLEKSDSSNEGSSTHEARDGSRASGSALGGGGGSLGLGIEVPGHLSLVLGFVQLLLRRGATLGGNTSAGLGHVARVLRGTAVVSEAQGLKETGLGRIGGPLAGEHLVAGILRWFIGFIDEESKC